MYTLRNRFENEEPVTRSLVYGTVKDDPQNYEFRIRIRWCVTSELKDIRLTGYSDWSVTSLGERELEYLARIAVKYT